MEFDTNGFGSQGKSGYDYFKGLDDNRKKQYGLIYNQMLKTGRSNLEAQGLTENIIKGLQTPTPPSAGFEMPQMKDPGKTQFSLVNLFQGNGFKVNPNQASAEQKKWAQDYSYKLDSVQFAKYVAQQHPEYLDKYNETLQKAYEANGGNTMGALEAAQKAMSGVFDANRTQGQYANLIEAAAGDIDKAIGYANFKNLQPEQQRRILDDYDQAGMFVWDDEEPDLVKAIQDSYARVTGQAANGAKPFDFSGRKPAEDDEEEITIDFSPDAIDPRFQVKAGEEETAAPLTPYQERQANKPSLEKNEEYQKLKQREKEIELLMLDYGPSSEESDALRPEYRQVRERLIEIEEETEQALAQWNGERNDAMKKVGVTPGEVWSIVTKGLLGIYPEKAEAFENDEQVQALVKEYNDLQKEQEIIDHVYGPGSQRRSEEIGARMEQIQAELGRIKEEYGAVTNAGEAAKHAADVIYGYDTSKRGEYEEAFVSQPEVASLLEREEQVQNEYNRLAFGDQRKTELNTELIDIRSQIDKLWEEYNAEERTGIRNEFFETEEGKRVLEGLNNLGQLASGTGHAVGNFFESYGVSAKKGVEEWVKNRLDALRGVNEDYNIDKVLNLFWNALEKSTDNEQLLSEFSFLKGGPIEKYAAQYSEAMQKYIDGDDRELNRIRGELTNSVYELMGAYFEKADIDKYNDMDAIVGAFQFLNDYVFAATGEQMGLQWDSLAISLFSGGADGIGKLFDPQLYAVLINEWSGKRAEYQRKNVKLTDIDRQLLTLECIINAGIEIGFGNDGGGVEGYFAGQNQFWKSIWEEASEEIKQGGVSDILEDFADLIQGREVRHPLYSSDIEDDAIVNEVKLWNTLWQTALTTIGMDAVKASITGPIAMKKARGQELTAEEQSQLDEVHTEVKNKQEEAAIQQAFADSVNDPNAALKEADAAVPKVNSYTPEEFRNLTNPEDTAADETDEESAAVQPNAEAAQAEAEKEITAAEATAQEEPTEDYAARLNQQRRQIMDLRRQQAENMTMDDVRRASDFQLREALEALGDSDPDMTRAIEDELKKREAKNSASFQRNDQYPAQQEETPAEAVTVEGPEAEVADTEAPAEQPEYNFSNAEDVTLENTYASLLKMGADADPALMEAIVAEMDKRGLETTETNAGEEQQAGLVAAHINREPARASHRPGAHRRPKPGNMDGSALRDALARLSGEQTAAEAAQEEAAAAEEEAEAEADQKAPAAEGQAVETEQPAEPEAPAEEQEPDFTDMKSAEVDAWLDKQAAKGGDAVLPSFEPYKGTPYTKKLSAKELRDAARHAISRKQLFDQTNRRRGNAPWAFNLQESLIYQARLDAALDDLRTDLEADGLTLRPEDETNFKQTFKEEEQGRLNEAHRALEKKDTGKPEDAEAAALTEAKKKAQAQQPAGQKKEEEPAEQPANSSVKTTEHQELNRDKLTDAKKAAQAETPVGALVRSLDEDPENEEYFLNELEKQDLEQATGEELEQLVSTMDRLQVARPKLRKMAQNALNKLRSEQGETEAPAGKIVNGPEPQALVAGTPKQEDAEAAALAGAKNGPQPKTEAAAPAEEPVPQPTMPETLPLTEPRITVQDKAQPTGEKVKPAGKITENDRQGEPQETNAQGIDEKTGGSEGAEGEPAADNYNPPDGRETAETGEGAALTDQTKPEQGETVEEAAEDTAPDGSEIEGDETGEKTDTSKRVFTATEEPEKRTGAQETEKGKITEGGKTATPTGAGGQAETSPLSERKGHQAPDAAPGTDNVGVPQSTGKTPDGNALTDNPKPDTVTPEDPEQPETPTVEEEPTEEPAEETTEEPETEEEPEQPAPTEELTEEETQQRDENAKKFRFKTGKTLGDGSTDAGVHLTGSGARVSDAGWVQLQMIDRLAKHFGFSAEVGSGIRKDADGKYDGGRTIYINENAKNPFDQVMGHELYHMVKRISPASAQKIERIFDKWAARGGLNITKQVEAKIAQYKKSGVTLDPLKAKEEIIANAMYTFLSDANTIRQVYNADQNLFSRIMDFVNQVQQSIREMLSRYERNTPEARVLSRQEGALRELNQAMLEALTEMKGLDPVKKAATEYQVGNSTTKARTDMTRAYSERMKNAASKREMNDAARALADEILKKTGNKVDDAAKEFNRVYYAAMGVKTGLTPHEAMTSVGLNYEKNDPAVNEALRMLGNYVEAVNQTGDAEWLTGMMEGEEAQESGEKFELNDEEPDVFKMSWKEQVRNYKQFPSNTSMLLGRTPAALVEIGFSNLPMTMKQHHVSQAMTGVDRHGRYDKDHHLGEQLLIQLPDLMRYPVAVIASESQPSDSVVVIIDTVINGKKQIAAINIDTKARLNNLEYDVNNVSTTLGKIPLKGDNENILEKAIKNHSENHKTVFMINSKKAKRLVGEGLQLPNSTSSNGFVSSIHDEHSPVNSEFIKQTDTKQFKRFFRDSVATENGKAGGNPLKLYHQTENEIYVFDPKHEGAGTSDTETPHGVFLKPTDKDIGLKGKKQMALYARIEHPLTFENRAAAVKWYEEHIDGYAEARKEAATVDERYHEKYDALEQESDEWYKAHWKEMRANQISDEEIEKGTRKKEIDQLFNEWHEAGMMAAKKAKDILDQYFENSKYDGIHLLEDAGSFGRKIETWIAFKNNQVKSATENIGTFNPDNPDIRYSIPAAQEIEEDMPQSRDEVYSKMAELNEERQALRREVKSLSDGMYTPDIMERISSTDKAVSDAALQEVKDYEEKNGIKDKQDRVKELDKEISRLYRQIEALRIKDLQDDIERSGLSQEEYFRKAAVKEFGYTPHFYDAGYILPNGKMLNFSGEKGKHFGMRGQDHRAIGTVFEGMFEGTDALNAFVNMGNIRIMDESPGVDISAGMKLTPEQRTTLRKHIRERIGENGYFVDMTGADGRTIASLEYSKNTKADKILADIDYVQETGEAPRQSDVADFHAMYSVPGVDDGLDFSSEGLKEDPADAGEWKYEEDVARAGKTKSAFDLLLTLRDTKRREKTEQYGNWRQHIGEMARTLKEETGSGKYTAEQIEKELNEIFEMYESHDGSTAEDAELAVNEALDMLQDLVGRMLVDEVYSDEVKAVRDWMRRGIYLDEAQAKELGGKEERKYFRQVVGVPVYYDKNKAYKAKAVHMDGGSWEELHELAPSAFPMDDDPMNGSYLDRPRLLQEYLMERENMTVKNDPQLRDFVASYALETLADYYSRSDEGDATSRLREANRRANNKAASLEKALQKSMDAVAKLTEENKELDKRWRQADSDAFVHENRENRVRAELKQAQEENERLRGQVNAGQVKQEIREERADLQQRLQQAMEEQQKTAKELRAAQKEQKKLMDQLDRIDSRATHLESTLKAVRSENDKKMKQAIRENRAKWKAQAEQRAEAAKYKKNIKKTLDKLMRMTTNPSPTAYIPMDKLVPLMDLVEAAYKADTRNMDNLVNAWMRRVSEMQESPNWYVANTFDKGFVDQMREVCEILQDSTINSMEMEDLKYVSDTFTETLHQIQNATTMIDRSRNKDALKESKNAIDANEKQKGMSKNGFIRGLQGINLQQLRPKSFLRMLSGYRDTAWSRIGEDFIEGQRKQNRANQEMSDAFRSLTEGENAKLFDKFTGKNAELIDTGMKDKRGRAIKITQAQRVSLFLHAQNKDNLRHFVYEVTLPDQELLKKGKKKEAFDRSLALRINGMDDYNAYSDIHEEIREMIRKKKKGNIGKAQEEEMRVKLRKFAGKLTGPGQGNAREAILSVANSADFDGLGYASSEMAKLASTTIKDKMINAKKVIQELTAGMTEYERAWVKAYQQMEKMSTRMINEVSMKLNGYEKAQVENYFPIKTDKNFLAKDFESLISDGTIEGMGMLKKRIKGSNPMTIEDVTDVIARMINNTSLYYGMAIPVRNFNKMYNGTLADYEDSVKASLKRVWGSEGAEYMERLLTDIQGNGRSEERSFLDVFRGHYAGAVLTLNPSVMMKQAASLPTAAASLGWEPILKALTSTRKADPAIINKYTSAYMERVGGGIRDMEANAQRNTALKRGVHKMGNGIQAVDLATVRKIWTACEFYVEEQQPGLKRGSDEYYQAVARAYETALEDTQPEYGVMQRPHILRSRNQLTRSMTMFKTQSLQNYNILFDAAQAYRAKQADYKAEPSQANKQALDQAKTQLARAVSSQVVSAAVLAVMTALGKALLHKPEPYQDEKGEVTAGSVSYQLSKDAISSMAGMMIGGSEVYDLIMGIAEGKAPFDIEAGNVSVLNDLYQSVYKLGNAATAIGDSSLTPEQKWQKLQKAGTTFLESVASSLGIPMKNAENIFTSAYKYYGDISSGRGLEGLTTGDVSLSTGAKYMGQALMAGDRDTYTRLYNRLLGQGKSESQINSAIKSWVKGNDPRIREAAEAIDGGDLATYNRLINDMAGDGYGMAMVVNAIEAVRKSAGTEETAAEAGEAPGTLTYDQIMARQENESASAYTYAQLNSLLEAGNTSGAKQVQSALFKTKGTTAVKSALTSYWKPKYQEAYQSRNRTELNRITRLLKAMGYSDASISKWKQVDASGGNTSSKKTGFGKSFGGGFGSSSKKSGVGSGFGSKFGK